MEAREMMVRNVQARSNQLVEAWAPLLEGVGDEKTEFGRRKRAVVAQLFQNELEALGRGNMAGGTMQLREDTTSANAGIVTTFMLPLIKLVWRNMIGHEVATIQPIDGPTGTMFTLQRFYQNAKGSTPANTEMLANLDPNYASENINNELLATGDGVQFGGGGAALNVTLGYRPVRSLDAALAYSCVITEQTPAGVVVQTATDNGSTGFTFAPGGAFTGGSIAYATGQITNLSFQTAPVLGNLILANYQWNMEGSNLVPEIYHNIVPRAVVPVPRKLKYRYSTEGKDAIMAVHGIDVEQMLNSDAAHEITLEIDRDILGVMFRASAGYVQTFNFTVPPGISELDHIRAVLTRMSYVGAQVQMGSGYAPANFFVTDPLVAAFINQTRAHENFRPLWTPQGAPSDPFTGDVAPPSYTPEVAQAGIMRMGLVNQSWMGYTDSNFAASTGGHFIMMGLKGQGWWNAGVGYCPWIPIELMPPLYNPENDTTVRLIRTMDKIMLVRSEYFGRVRITGGI